MNRHMYARQQEKNYLAHHGIKGQKWGIRRYQNEDGSLTPEGKERYGDPAKFNAIKKALKEMQQDMTAWNMVDDKDLMDMDIADVTKKYGKGYKEDFEKLLREDWFNMPAYEAGKKYKFL